MEPKALRKKIEKREHQLMAARAPFDKGNRSVAKATLPLMSSYMAGGADRYSDVTKGFYGTGLGGYADGMRPVLNERLYNSAVPAAWRICSHGLAAGLSSTSQPWFKLVAQDRELRDYHSVKVWFDQVNEIVRQFVGKTNLYEEMQKGYGEMAWAGTEATLFTGHWKYGGVATNLTYGSYWIGLDDAGRPNTLLRDAPMTVENLIKRVGGSIDQVKERVSNTVRNLIEKEQFGAIIPIRHIIEPNDDIVFGVAKGHNKPFRSVYYEGGTEGKDNKRAILSISGFDRVPFGGARWNTYGQSPYGWGPAMEALPEARKVQIQEVRFQTGLDYAVRPALQAPIQGNGHKPNLTPAGITYTAATDMNAGMRPVWEPKPETLNALRNDIAGRTEPAIDRAFYVSMFQPITASQRGSQPRTAEEIARVHEESLALIGPVTDRIQTEKLSVFVLQAFQICSDAGLLPPLPEELEGSVVAIEYVSVLAQAQRMIGINTIERGVGFLGNLAGIQPTIMDLANLDETLIEYYDRIGMSAKALRPMEEVEASRQARAQQEQQAQMAAMMPAVQQGADAARLMAEAAEMPAMQGLMSGV